jgi:histidinol-phosphatase (PHP family)
LPWFSYHGGHSGEFSATRRARSSRWSESALRGLLDLRISEHAPRYRALDLFPDEADLGVDDLARIFEGYLEAARALRDRHADRVEILIGFESEVLPPQGWAEQMIALRRSSPELDYVVGSVHHVGGASIDMSPELTARVAEEVGGREAIERLYFELVAEMVERLRPEIVGHLT